MTVNCSLPIRGLNGSFARRRHCPCLYVMTVTSSTIMSSPSRFLVNHKYAEDSHLPSEDEIMVVQYLVGPVASHSLPSRVARHAVVLDIDLKVFQPLLFFTVLPMPSYSAADLNSGLSSTSWLLSQPADFQRQHIPVPYEQSSLTQPQPPFSTLARFGDPLEMGGWKNRRPRGGAWTPTREIQRIRRD